jgi:drug/metabolite transporter (DMT)-like permease
VAKYPAICVAAWSYVTAAVCMGATALLFVEQDGWEVPRQLWGPLVYWIFICSVIGYYVVTWATQYLPASQVIHLSQRSRSTWQSHIWFSSLLKEINKSAWKAVAACVV